MNRNKSQNVRQGYFVLEKVLETSPLDPWLTALMADLCCGKRFESKWGKQRYEFSCCRIVDGDECATGKARSNVDEKQLREERSQKFVLILFVQRRRRIWQR